MTRSPQSPQQPSPRGNADLPLTVDMREPSGRLKDDSTEPNLLPAPRELKKWLLLPPKFSRVLMQLGITDTDGTWKILTVMTLQDYDEN